MTPHAKPESKPVEPPKDEVVGIAALSDHFMVVTKYGKLYSVSKDDKDLVKLWVEVPV